MVNSAQLAEDLTQEAFLKLYKAKVKEPAAVYTYLRQIARHLVYDHYRKKALIEWLPFSKKDEGVATHYVPHEWLSQDEERKILYEALQQLKPLQREVIICRKIEDLSLQETSEYMGISQIKVANTQRSAMQALAKILGGEADEDE